MRHTTDTTPQHREANRHTDTTHRHSDTPEQGSQTPPEYNRQTEGASVHSKSEGSQGASDADMRAPNIRGTITPTMLRSPERRLTGPYTGLQATGTYRPTPTGPYCVLSVPHLSTFRSICAITPPPYGGLWGRGRTETRNRPARNTGHPHPSPPKYHTKFWGVSGGVIPTREWGGSVWRFRQNRVTTLIWTRAAPWEDCRSTGPPYGGHPAPKNMIDSRGQGVRGS